jgi:5'-nucleotidase/UDP-sugar diphosphatase
MKHFLLLGAIIGLFAVQISLAQTDTITIIHVNDTHSCLAPIGPRDAALHGTLGGIARAATLFGMIRATSPNPILLHGGDVFIGDLFFNVYFGVAEFQLMQALGFDAMAVGNHEFDLTPSTLQTALDTAFVGGGFPLLSANLILEDNAVKSLKKYIHPYTIKQMGSIKVGIFGLTTPSTNVLSLPQPAVVDTNIIQIAASMVDTLTTKGCTVIICLSHLGVTLDEAVASYVPGIHVIVGAHDHYKFNTPIKVANPSGDTTFIVQANAFYLNAGKLTLTVSDGKVHGIDYTMFDIDNSIPEDPTIKTIVDGLIAGIEKIYGPVFTQRIGYAKSDFEEVADSLTTDGYKDTPIGNLVTDAFRAALKTDIAIEAGGSTAQKLYKGPIVADDLFRVVGYGFNQENGLGYHLAKFKMSGEALIAGLEFGLSDIEENDEYLLQSSGLSYTYNAHRPVGSRVVSALVGKEPLDPKKIYTVAANEFVPSFLTYVNHAFSDKVTYSDCTICTGDTTEFQVLCAYVSALDTIEPVQREGIVSPVKREVTLMPQKFELNQNYPNPFNPSTTISFEIPTSSFVSLKLFNLLGEEVATLVNEDKQAGKYNINWNGGRCASGIYFYHLRAGSYDATRKLVLMK